MKKPKKLLWNGGEIEGNEQNELISRIYLKCHPDGLSEGPDAHI
jgi:hypothetical protein